ncbi:hypothetical protein SAMN05660971_00461 [Halomonas cupida]|uniref:Uncharacterized protein n=1 Tax=Halomonas cupida TaxID=44933 RepID=A0A1M7AD94_9GAMM|nr:hypothetical protein SAMN05660971_00461 [Halomonas cupida]
MTYNLFPSHAATSLRRSHDGSVRSINWWNNKKYKFFPPMKAGMGGGM